MNDISKTEIVVDTTQTIEAICHRCGIKFEAHPLYCDGHLILFPNWVCKACHEKDKTKMKDVKIRTI